jgi:hypothetical protein
MSGDWRGTLWTLLVTFCIVIIRCTETFWSPCIFWVCVSVILVIRHAQRTHRVIPKSVPCPAVPYFYTSSHKRHAFLTKKSVECQMCFQFLYNFCLNHFSFYEELSEIWSKIYIGLHVKYRLLLSDFNGTWISQQIFKKSSDNRFNKNLQITGLIKILR